MAGTVMHLVIADRLMEQLNINNPTYFYCGNLAPDAIMARDNYIREMKRHTHFKDNIRLHEFHNPENMRIYLQRLKTFYSALVAPASKHQEIYLGYMTHMLVDELYLLLFRDRHVRKLVEEGKMPTDEEYFKLYTKDVDLVDWELVRNYRFKHPMPQVLETDEPYEIPGYITYDELIKSKRFIVLKNFETVHKDEPLKVMTMEENKEFIEQCVERIPKMLIERFEI